MMFQPSAPRSYVEDQDGDWRKHKPSLLGVVGGFCSHLRAGEEVTHAPVPAQLLCPYSLLEVVAFRQLTCFDLLLPLNATHDPLERMVLVTHWYLCTLQPESCDRKPYNPVLGETNRAPLARRGGPEYRSCKAPTRA